jgi:hypothetical protein
MDTTSAPAKTARMTVFGGEVHLDHQVAGNGYVGYSHIKAANLLPLADGVEVLHGYNGYGFKDNYFGVTDPAYFAARDITSGPLPPPHDSGSVDSVLFQYMIKASNILGWDLDGPDVGLTLYGMFNHIKSDLVNQDRMKFGAELGASPYKYIWITVRGDRVLPDGTNTAVAYSAVSPRVIVHTRWLSREYVVLSYSHFFLGDQAYPSPPYQNLAKADPNLFVLSAALSF